MTSEIDEAGRPAESPASGVAVPAALEEGPSESSEEETMRRLLRDLDVANDWHPDCGSAPG